MTDSKNRETRLKGLALSKGCAVGKVCMFSENRHRNLPMYLVEGESVDREIARVARARDIAGQKLEKIREKVKREIGSAESEIFVAQKMILDDEPLSTEIMIHIQEEGTNAESAIAHVFDGYEARLAALDDEYISAKATDIGEIKRRLLDVLGNMRASLQCNEDHCRRGRNRVIVAEELTPTLTVDIDPKLTIGFVTEHGGINSHAAILARAMGIPAVSGLAGIRERLGCGAELLIDGATGEVVIWPTEETLSGVATARSRAVGLPEPVDPVPGFKVMANVNAASDVEECLRMGAEGIGLYRTEFELISAGRFLSEDELYERYASVRSTVTNGVVVFRLFDVGSDKTLPFMEMPKEENPSLGWRGARLLLGQRELLETQARALARTSEVGPVHVLYPMIIDLDQFLELKDVFMQAIRDITCGNMQHGVMFEVPAACAQAQELFQHVDFASIGTNDLTQYFFAVDRENELVSYDYNPDRPVFWNLLKNIADAAGEAGKPVCVCGEMAGYPEYVPRLMSIGIDTVSVSARRIPEVRTAAANAGTRGAKALEHTLSEVACVS